MHIIPPPLLFCVFPAVLCLSPPLFSLSLTLSLCIFLQVSLSLFSLSCLSLLLFLYPADSQQEGSSL